MYFYSYILFKLYENITTNKNGFINKKRYLEKLQGLKMDMNPKVP